MQDEKTITQQLTKSESEQTINSITSEIQDQLTTAIKKSELEKVKNLLDAHSNFPINRPDNLGLTLLHYAAGGLWGNQYVEDKQPNRTLRRNSVAKQPMNNYVEITNLLLLKGADSSITDQDGKTPLLLAVETGHDKQLIELIRKSNPDLIGATDNRGNTVLHLAMSSDIKTFEIISYLLPYAAHLINKPNYYGVYALHNLFAKGTATNIYEITVLCLEQGAIATCINESLESLLHCVAAKSNNEALTKLLIMQIEKQTIKAIQPVSNTNYKNKIKKAIYKEVNKRDMYGETPLHKATRALLELNDRLLTKAVESASKILTDKSITSATLMRCITGFFSDIMLKLNEDNQANHAPPLKTKDYDLLKQNINKLMTENEMTQLATTKQMIIYMLTKQCDPAVIDIRSRSTFSYAAQYPKLKALFQPYITSTQILLVPNAAEIDPEIKSIIFIKIEFKRMYTKLQIMQNKLSPSLITQEEQEFFEDIKRSFELFKEFEKLYESLWSEAPIQDYTGEKIERIIVRLITQAKDKCVFYQGKLNHYIKVVMKLSEHLRSIDGFSFEFRQSLINEIERHQFLEKFCFYEKKFFGLIFSIAYHAPNMNYWVKNLAQRFQQIKDDLEKQANHHFDKEELQERKADENFEYPLLILKLKLLLLQHPETILEARKNPTKSNELTMLEKKLAEGSAMSAEGYQFFKQALLTWQHYLIDNADNKDSRSAKAMIQRGMSITEAPAPSNSNNDSDNNSNATDKSEMGFTSPEFG